MLRGLTDPQEVSSQYQNSSNLDARIQLHRRFSTNPYGFHRWYFDQLDLPAQARLLELGCGSGALWLENADRIPEGWDVTLTDLSSGMLEDARRNLSSVGQTFTFARADAQDVPFPDASFDAVIANHMLYHVPNRPRALSEIRRVLRPGGRLYAATNGQGHMRELPALLDEPEELDQGTGFGLENGREQLEPWFEHVVLNRYEDGLVVTEKEPLLAYFRSAQRSDLLDAETWEALEERIEEEIERSGAMLITKSTGLFEAW